VSELLGELNQNVTNAISKCNQISARVGQAGGSRTKSGQPGGVKFNLSWIWWKSEMSLPVTKPIIYQLTGKEKIFSGEGRLEAGPALSRLRDKI
jgi:hypothetical protein